MLLLIVLRTGTFLLLCLLSANLVSLELEVITNKSAQKLSAALKDNSQLKDKVASLKKYRVNTIQVVIKPIFDLDKDEKKLYKLANEWHVNTQPWVVRRLLPFEENSEITDKDIAEAERILRQQRFFREAMIEKKVAEDGFGYDIQVTTWDNWTLFPTIDYKSEAGATDISYGIQDDNFLGLGLATNFQYLSESERTGYIFSVGSRVFSNQNLRAGVLVANNSDGERFAVNFEKPFFRLNDPYGYTALFDSERRDESIYSNDQIVNKFELNRDEWELSYALAHRSLQSDFITRYRAGVTKSVNRFQALPTTSLLPQDRDYLYPWLEVEYQQDYFLELYNINKIDIVEDIQVGWYSKFRIGFNTLSGPDEGAYIWSLQSSYTQQINDKHLYIIGFYGNGVYQTKRQPTIGYYGLSYEHFYQVDDKATWYIKADISAADNAFVDKPIALGGETGLRGYPKQYQQGKRKYLLSLEKRIYPKINLWQLADLGFVGFIDLGQASGEGVYINNETGVLGSVGFGLRFFLSRSSSKNVINVNLSKPIISDVINDIDISVVIRSRF